MNTSLANQQQKQIQKIVTVQNQRQKPSTVKKSALAIRNNISECQTEENCRWIEMLGAKNSAQKHSHSAACISNIETKEPKRKMCKNRENEETFRRILNVIRCLPWLWLPARMCLTFNGTKAELQTPRNFICFIISIDNSHAKPLQNG